MRGVTSSALRVSPHESPTRISRATVRRALQLRQRRRSAASSGITTMNGRILVSAVDPSRSA